MGKIPGEGRCLAKVPWRVPYLLEGRQAGIGWKNEKVLLL